MREEVDVTTSPSSSAIGEGVPIARSRAGEDLTMGDQRDGATRQFYFLARLETYDDANGPRCTGRSRTLAAN